MAEGADAGPDDRQPLMTGATGTLLQVHLEDAGARSWWAALANVLAGSNGSAQYRFVARPPSLTQDATSAPVVGATFPVVRAQDLADRSSPNAWIEIAEERLDELDRRLLADGWVRTGEAGRHWWSRTYVRRSEQGSKQGSTTT